MTDGPWKMHDNGDGKTLAIFFTIVALALVAIGIGIGSQL